ncbi:exodeoxyribonuclease VII large subunit [Vagococcus fessus]|uniref:Exodeoxyribonuclease 7 large subunit n=1 Tax=Vagococcus fessus TaxID=120370 RepID=A0A430A7Y5_9ENTE|nr:exodeoxyribonuclease VII large subunit [Vagococcus fessus]RSU03212.1 exodeoxyribonuclease VII large subunit [Vagococcus fessus]
MAEKYLSVTALTKYIKRKFEVDPHLGRVYLTGEISNFRPRPNAHQYFSLKDDKAKIGAVMFKGAYQKLKFQPKEGMKVLVVGRVSVYEASGNYQITIEHMEPDGVGALYQALAELREKLEREGLFSLPKKELTRYPKRVAVVTSPSGAVIRDIMTTVKRRYPIAQLVLFPTLVQGDKAAQNICDNLDRIEEMGNFDTVIVARGGGSIEDLWPFNEENVARKIVSMSLPVISSVGHETDTTIADLVADVRAATPTAAAELAVPVLSDELLKIKEKENRLVKSYVYQLERQKQRFTRTQESFVFKQPERLYEGFSVKLDMLVRRFQQEGLAIVSGKKEHMIEVINKLYLQNPSRKVEQASQQLTHNQSQLEQAMKAYMKQKEIDLGRQIQSLDILSPLKTMSRGYTYVTTPDKLLTSVTNLQQDEVVTLHFSDGEADVAVNEIRSKTNESEEK